MKVEYLIGDHLGSTSLTTDSNGNKISELRYKPWGETRYTWTDPSLDTTPAYAMTRYQYTGQFSYESEFGLYFYNARWYDSYLNHFTQPDSIVPNPGDSQAWDRYAYANNNPVKYIDPSGHCSFAAMERGECTAADLNGGPPDINELATQAMNYALAYDGNALESWAATSDFIAGYTGDDVEMYMAVMDRVFGHLGDGLQLEGNTSRDCFLCGVKNPDGSLNRGLRPTGYYDEYTVNNDPKFENSDGFNPAFADPDGTNNQVQHTYFWVQVGYHHGLTTALAGNLSHEFLEGRDEGSWPRPGQSVADYNAGEKGAVLGAAIYNGLVKPQQVGTYILNAFGNP